MVIKYVYKFKGLPWDDRVMDTFKDNFVWKLSLSIRLIYQTKVHIYI
jgi:hypothetical protein